MTGCFYDGTKDAINIRASSELFLVLTLLTNYREILNKMQQLYCDQISFET